MIGAGTIINPLIKIVTTVAILAAVYFFILKPTLDTTESISSGIGTSISESFDSFSPEVKRSVREARRLRRQSSRASQAQLETASKLLNCIGQADGDVERIAACNRRFSP